MHFYQLVGAATVRIAMPNSLQSSLIFHYNLKCYENDGDTFDGVSLKRFVMQVSEKKTSSSFSRLSFNR